MTHDWILDVLSDLRAYAERNALSELAAGLDETLRLARAELGAAPPVPEQDEPPPRPN
ncbi:hypothetical protein GQF56_02405 [Rhodobacter sphaeroides]|jgi:hypothetical protein|uniref:Uncharacterized protein n=1 Tax=Cereibacter sphaeroides (strain ATCC 17023 / DSM 158 / JCM 6121 / CCUG 31486 / LMG 2827 / NBRC 12203 / NCIMB 8253 / ATH 2.4.1.) TaxID=272943 RepID=U5NMW6_CERS4|nr:hypothetical protein [Cereibacter sphaeroides]AGY32443.1 hypothetical protein RSP_7572 [Cereibacter sphaeroides 2.4.1]AXC62336.1 hypothetical protein DQL45_13500 [Cereibacter sphaeroides 2.4.1]MVX46726.1 hypothetical protein [Cereibacter sphaeroides]QHA11405.1 hypothetical protein GQR99_13480 [Cereibacter sphaeroides]QHA14189.1 hypothetical protein GQY06_13455 [Cereibacter sphaeroides]